MKRRSMKKMIALLMAAATMTVGTANVIAPVSTMAETVANAEILPAELSEILPETETEANEFRWEYGDISIHGGYIVMVTSENDRPYDLITDAFGESELDLVYERSCFDKDNMPAPGSNIAILRVFKPTAAGVMRVHWYYTLMYGDTTEELLTKYYNIDKDMNIEEITKEDFARGFLWQEKTFDLRISGNTMIFKNNDPDSELSVIVSSNLNHKVTTDGKTASFTPSEDGRYVVSVENMVTWTMRDDNLNGYDYKYPLLSNYVVDIKDGFVSYSYKGIRNYYDGAQIEELNEKYFSDDKIKDTSPYAVEMFSSYDYYFRGCGPYYAFVNNYMKNSIKDTSISSSYITNIFRPNKTESYFNVISSVYDETGWHIENNRCIEHMGRFDTSSSCDGDLKNPTPDLLTNYVFMACGGSGQGSVTVDGVSYELNIVDDVFVPETGVSDSIKEIIPNTIDEYKAFVKKYGEASIHGEYLIFCTPINYSTGTDLRLDQWGNGVLEHVGTYTMPEEEPIVDGAATFTVNLYKASAPGVLKAEWFEYNQWSNYSNNLCTKYYAIDGGMGIVEIDKDKYELNYMFDPEIPQDVQGVLPVTFEKYKAFVKKYGSVSTQGGYVIFCEDVNLNKGERLGFSQSGDGSFEAVMAYDVDAEDEENGKLTHTVVVYKAAEPGTVKTVWELSSPEMETKKEILEKYYSIDDKLNVTEITAEEFYPIIRGDANGDGVFTIADMTVMGRWLLGKSDVLPNPRNVDVCRDGKVDVYDFTALRKEVPIKVAASNSSSSTLVNAANGNLTENDPASDWVNMGTIS